MDADSEDVIALLRAAEDAIEAARSACEGTTIEETLLAAARLARDATRSAVARATDIAIGDAVVTFHPSYGNRSFPLAKVGPKWISLSGTRYVWRYARDTGRGDDLYGVAKLNADDLARINRCFPLGKRTPR